MALTYDSTDATRVRDKPVGYDPAVTVFPTNPTYVKTYSLSSAKTAVDTADAVTNFTALVADATAQVSAIIASDFDDTVNTITAAGRITAFDLEGGSKYDNTVNIASYSYFIEVDIEVVII